ncbi:MAG: GNAT family N-acetyltransferase [Candidatus Cloacimonetes bacterium]|nr:GNAT family N-acetyltransferase [Candidatus Cloacimonadota bacterium]
MQATEYFWVRVLPHEKHNIDLLLKMEKILFLQDAVNLYTLVPLVAYQRAYLYQDRNGNSSGYALVMNHSQSSDTAYLFSYGIMPQFQGIGLGTGGFKDLVHLLYGEGFAKMELTVSPSNTAALSIYRLLPVLEETLFPDHYGENQTRICLLLKLGNIFHNLS